MDIIKVTSIVLEIITLFPTTKLVINTYHKWSFTNTEYKKLASLLLFTFLVMWFANAFSLFVHIKNTHYYAQVRTLVLNLAILVASILYLVREKI